MSQNKKAYFQGGGGPNEPTPKKKKYKSDKAIVVQPRFEEFFYRNYDVYDVEGEHGPGAGVYHNKYTSIADFLKHRRKHLIKKYKSNDSWIEDNKPNKEERVKKMKTRANLLSQLTKFAIDFTIDDTIDSSHIGEPVSSYQDSVQLDGLLDEYLPLNDFEQKSPDKLNFGRDYEGDAEMSPDMLDLLNKIEGKYLNPKEPDLLGMPNGFEPEEDLDADKTVNNLNPEYGITDSGNTLYDKMWI